MNSISNVSDSTKRAETPYFHCGPSGSSCFSHYSYHCLRNFETLAKWSLQEVHLFMQLMVEFEICKFNALRTQSNIEDEVNS